jgi:hypothetical protein
MSYDLPFKGNRLKDGWQLVVVEQAQTGNPLNVITNITTITGVSSVRPDLIGALPAIVATPNLDPVTGAVTSYQWFASNTVCDPRVAGSCTSASVFALPYNAAGVAHFGNLPRNAIYGPGFGNTDLSIIKNVSLAGSAKAQLRLEIFNLFNQANLGQIWANRGARRRSAARRSALSAPRASRPAIPDRRGRCSSRRSFCSDGPGSG